MAKQKGTFYIDATLSSQRNGNQQIKKAEYGKGDHFKVVGVDKNGNPIMAVIPVNLQGNGTECKIKKILQSLGVLLVFALVCLGYYSVFLA